MKVPRAFTRPDPRDDARRPQPLAGLEWWRRHHAHAPPCGNARFTVITHASSNARVRVIAIHSTHGRLRSDEKNDYQRIRRDGL